MGCHNNVSGRQVHIRSRPQHPWNSGGVQCFTGGPGDLGCALCEQEFYTYYSLSLLLHGGDRAVGGRD